MRIPIILMAITALAACSDAGSGSVDEAEAVLPAENDDPALVERSLSGMEPLDGEAAGTSPADDINLDARTRYATYYRGAYAPNAVCDGSKSALELEQTTVRYGDTVCQIASIDKSGKGIEVKGQRCKAGEDNKGDRSYTLLMTEMQTLDLKTGATAVSLERCGTA